MKIKFNYFIILSDISILFSCKMSLAKTPLIHLKYQVILWEWSGIISPKTFKKFLYIFLIHLIGDFMYLPTLVLGCILAKNSQEVFLGLSYTMPVMCIFFRMISTYLNYEKLLKTSELFEILNKRAEGYTNIKLFSLINNLFTEKKDERKIIEDAIRKSQMLFKFICFFYNMAVSLMEVLVTFIIPGRMLISPSWMPFDWQNNDITYVLVNIFQYISLTYQTFLGAGVDTEPSGNMILLTGHLRALRTRIMKIGWDSCKSLDDNYQDIVSCIIDHSMLLE